MTDDYAQQRASQHRLDLIKRETKLVQEVLRICAGIDGVAVQHNADCTITVMVFGGGTFVIPEIRAG